MTEVLVDLKLVLSKMCIDDGLRDYSGLCNHFPHGLVVSPKISVYYDPRGLLHLAGYVFILSYKKLN